MFEISEEQEALLRLPDPSTFFPLLCREIREDYPGSVGHLSDGALMDEVVRSHDHAAYVLRITHLPVLVRWVKADVAWARGLRAVPAADMWMRSAENPNLAAADLLSNLAGHWEQRWAPESSARGLGLGPAWEAVTAAWMKTATRWNPMAGRPPVTWPTAFAM